ncbi:MAG: hypothetical protein Q9183_000867 [Haloplaca sp. 2 TL-2023]
MKLGPDRGLGGYDGFAHRIRSSPASPLLKPLDSTESYIGAYLFFSSLFPCGPKSKFIQALLVYDKQQIARGSNMLARAARPKLALAVPAAPVASLAPKSPLLRTPTSPSPLSPTARNTRLNQRGLSTLQVPTFAYAHHSHNAKTKGILKKSPTSDSFPRKQLHFIEEPAVKCITPVPDDYHGTYVKMSRDERRWGKA